MELIPTEFRCNNRCVFCAQDGLSTEEFSKDEKDLVAKAKAACQKDSKIAFVGGEPTLHEGLLAAISAAKESGAAYILIQTNGRRLAYLSFAQNLKNAGADALDISLQGSTGPMHDYHTQTPGSWAQTILGIKRARETGFRIGISTVITRSNFRHLSEISRLAQHLGAEAFHLSLALPYGRAAKSWARVIPLAKMARPHLTKALDLSKSLGLKTELGQALSETSNPLFAGIGPHQRVELGTVPNSKELGTVPNSRPKPGLRERRGPLKTGTELKELFPEVFTGADIPGGKP